MKRINLFMALLLAGSTLSFGAAVPVNTAKTVGYNYLQQHGSATLKSEQDLQLLYTSSTTTACFYVFGTNECFVIVSAEDGVMPVLGYSTENTFRADHMPDNLSSYLGGYNEQIDYVIKNNIPADAAIANDWAKLIQNKKTTAAKTTAAVTPLLTTKWDQGAYYNTLCPADASATGSLGAHCPTGCVATAMAQVMRYWRWPNTGVSSSSYNSDYGLLSASFGTTTYKWGMMPFAVTANNNAVATLMSHAGIGVDMGYSATESGAYVTSMTSSGNTAEDALRDYFNYSPSLHGVARSSTSSTAWIAMLKTELNAARPVIYDGQGSSGGHCFVFDGYDATDNFHVNWGWSGNSDGYFTTNALNPAALGTGGGSGGFNSQQHVIIGVQPNGTPTSVTPDVYEVNDLPASAYTLPLTWTANVATPSTTGSNFHVATDKDYYKVILPAGFNYSIKARLNDGMNSSDATPVYTTDGIWAYSLNNGTTWSTTYADTMTGTGVFNITGYTGDTIMFRVIPKAQGMTGTYLMKATITRTGHPAGIDEVNMGAAIVYPNPATNLVTVDLSATGNTAKTATLTDMQGRIVYNAAVANQTKITIPVAELATGMYLLNVTTDGETIERKITVGAK